jgi:MFS transporter, DHA1 family, tetracycline resistance protein
MAQLANISTRALPAALLTVFIDAVGIAILIPIYTLLVLPGPQQVIPASWSMQDGFIMLGWLTGIYSLCIFLAAPLLGELSDKYGRKRVLALSLLGTAIGYVLFAIGVREKNLLLLFISRIIDGFTGGNIAVARAVIGDISTSKTRIRNYGLVGAMFGIGFVLGPYLGGRLATPDIPFIKIGSFELLHTPGWFGAATPFWFAAIIALIDVAVVLFVLPETNKNRSLKAKLHPAQAFHNIARAFKLPDLRPLFATTFLNTGGFTFFTTFFGLVLAERLAFRPNNIADFFSYIGVCIAVMQAIVVPILSRKFSSYRVVGFSLFGMSLAILTMFIPNDTTQLLLIAPLIPMFVAPVMANMVAIVSAVAGPKRQGEVMGINSSIEALAQGIPAVMSGYVASIALSLPLIVSSGILAMAGFVYWAFVRPNKLPKAVTTANPGGMLGEI